MRPGQNCRLSAPFLSRCGTVDHGELARLENESFIGAKLM